MSLGDKSKIQCESYKGFLGKKMCQIINMPNLLGFEGNFSEIAIFRL
jgi:hypothetical protein